MRRQDQFRRGLLVALLLTAPAVTQAEPIVRLTRGFIILDFTEPFPLWMDASGPNGSVSAPVGNWQFTSGITVGEGFVDPSYSGVANPAFVEELRLGDRLLQFPDGSPATLDLSVLGSPFPLPALENDEQIFITYPATFRGSLNGVFEEDLGNGEFQQVELSVGLTGRGEGGLLLVKREDVIRREAEISFFFQNATPIPEPSGILLLSAAGIVSFSRRFLRARNTVRKRGEDI